MGPTLQVPYSGSNQSVYQYHLSVIYFLFSWVGGSSSERNQCPDPGDGHQTPGQVWCGGHGQCLTSAPGPTTMGGQAWGTTGLQVLTGCKTGKV